MFHIGDPAKMSQNDRFSEIAGILAKGYLRLSKLLPPASKIVEKTESLPKINLASFASKSVHGQES